MEQGISFLKEQQQKKTRQEKQYRTNKKKTNHKERISSDNGMSTLYATNWLFYLYAPFEDCQDYKGMS